MTTSPVPIDTPVPGRTIPLASEPIYCYLSDSASRRECARRYDLFPEELAETIHPNDTLGAPRAMEKLFAAIDAEEARAPRRERSFELRSRISEFLSSLAPRTLAWSAIAAAVAILVPAAVITAIIVQEQGVPGGEPLARKADRLPMEVVLGPDIAAQPPPVALSENRAAFSGQAMRTEETPLGVGSQIAVQSPPPAAQAVGGLSAAQAPTGISKTPRKLSGEEIESLITRGLALISIGDIAGARLALKWAAEAGNATAALELGAPYDPFILRETQNKKPPLQGAQPVSAQKFSFSGRAQTPTMADTAMAMAWYEKAKELGSAEAAVRLDRLHVSQEAAHSPKR